MATPPPVAAQQGTNLYANGAWLVSRSASGSACTMYAKPAGVANGLYSIGYSAGRDFVVSSVWKEDWAIPKDASANVTLVIDRATVGTFAGLEVSRRSLVWPHGLPEWRTTIANLFMNGVQARVVFHGGNEPEWVLNLSGSTAAVAAFVSCANGLGGSLSPTPG